MLSLLLAVEKKWKMTIKKISIHIKKKGRERRDKLVRVKIAAVLE